MDSPYLDLKIIVAMDKNRAIGKNGVMPWHYPEDLKFFRSVTKDHTIIMGRKTYESIGKPLPNRKNIVLTKEAHIHPAVMVSEDLYEAIRTARMYGPMYVIGGSAVYKEALEYANTLWITKIPVSIEGADTFFPKLPDNFKLEESVKLSDQLIAEKWINANRYTPTIREYEIK